MRDAGFKTPLDIAPVYTYESMWFQETYRKVSKTRGSNGFALNPIPYTEYLAYFTIHEPIYELDFVVDILIAMDRVFLASTGAKVNETTAENNPGGRGSS